MKRVTAILLALAMLLSLTAVAFANGFTPSVTNKKVKAGETCEVKYTVDEDVKDMMVGEVRLFFDADLFDVDFAATKKADKLSSVGFQEKVFGEGAESYIKSSFLYLDENADFKAGDTYATLVVKAKESITEEKTATFKGVAENVENSTERVTNEFQLRSTTVTVVPVIKGYTVAVEKDVSVRMGEQAQVTLTIGNQDKNTYNAYDLTATYDTKVLEYAGVEQVKGETPTVSDENGTLHITGYGEDKTCGTDSIVLNFTAKAVGEGKVSVTDAKVDEKANAIDKDAPAATITAADATVTVGGYLVSLTDDFTGAETTTGQEDYTFAPKDAGNYDYTVTVKVGETDITEQVTKNDDGSYTIPKGLINGNITVTGSKTGKTRTVTITGEDTTGAATAQYGTDYTFTVDKKDGYNYEISVTVDGKTYTPTESSGTYTIAGAALTGDVVITVTKTSAAKAIIRETGNGWEKINVIQKTWSGDGAEVTPGTALTLMAVNSVNIQYLSMTVNGTAVQLVNMGGRFRAAIPGTLVTAGEVVICLTYNDPSATTSITFEGNGAEDVKGGTTQTATNGEDFTFSLNAEAGYTYEVKLGETALTEENGSYTIPAASITGTALTVTVTKTAIPAVKYTVTVSEYVKLNGKSVFLVKATATGVDEGDVLTYDGNQMYWSEKYNAYAWLVISDKSQSEVQEAANGLMGHAAGNKISITYDGDVNGSGHVDINDAQLVWNIYNAQYEDFQTVSVLKFLRADMTGDGKLDVTDAAAVVAIVNPKGK